MFPFVCLCVCLSIAGLRLTQKLPIILRLLWQDKMQSIGILCDILFNYTAEAICKRYRMDCVA